MRRICIGIRAALALLGFVTAASAQNALENGSFEISQLEPGNSATVARNQDLRPWQIVDGNAFYIGTVMTASEGSRSLQLNLSGPVGVQQVVQTPPGQSYRLYFDVSAYVGPNGQGARLMKLTATVRSTDAVLATRQASYDGTGKTLPNVGWTEYHLDFTATTAETYITFFSDEPGSYGAALDNVRLVPGREENGQWVISGPPVFLNRLPAVTQAVAGQPLRMEVEVLGDAPLAYQWYRVSNNNVWTTLAGATGSVYEIASFANNQNGTYAVVASNTLGSVTNYTSVTRISPPSIVSQPEEQRVVAGQQLNFGPRSFSGTIPDRWQWYKDGVAVEGQTNQNFFKASAELSDTGIYYVWGANLAGETRSADVPVTVFENGVPPWIQRNPLPAQINVQEGGFLNVSVVGAGNQPLNYFHYKDGQVVQSGGNSGYSKNNAQMADSGQYWVVLSNAFGMMTSTVAAVTIYPQQQPAVFQTSFVQTNVAEGVNLTLAPTLVQGSHLSFQWHKRPPNIFEGLGEPIPGANSLELPLGIVEFADAGQYTLVATNFAGQNQITYALSITARPILSSPLQGFEGAEFSSVNLVVLVENWSPGLTYQWYKDGTLIPGATQSSLRLTATAEAAGSYTVVLKNEAGETTSNPALVTVRPITPAAKQFHLVADYTIPVPGREPLTFQTVGDAHLRDNVVTFQSVSMQNDVGGLYRWEGGVREKIVDLNDMLPTFTATVDWYDGVSAEEGGITHFLGRATNSTGNKWGVFEQKDEAITPVAVQNLEVPGKPGTRLQRFGYTTRANGKTAFFGMETESTPGGYRCVLVWDGSTLQTWVSSDQPLPAGDGIWWNNSSQVGFDGTTLAFWAVDKTGGEGTRNGIFMSINGGPLQKIAFTGDPIPGLGGTFKGFSSPPRVHEGKVLFRAESTTGGDMLMEYAGGVLRVIAKSGDTPVGAGPIRSVQFGYDYLGDGSILFTASGPGTKHGIYNWRNGTISESLTTLNSIEGRPIRFVSLYDADGMDCLVTVSFDGLRFGLWTTAWGEEETGPTINVTQTRTTMTLSWSGGGVLQESTNLQTWNPLAVTSPHQVNTGSGSGRFFRVVEN